MNNLHFAVVVGINPYPGIGHLTAAHSDAEEFYDWATSVGGGKVPTENAIRILGELPAGAEASPTRETISNALGKFKDRVSTEIAADPTVWPQTRLYFFGAGHGIAPEARDSALLAANACRKSYTRHVSCTSLLEYFSRVQRFHELVLFADCCRTSVVGTVPRMPADWTDDSEDRGGVRKFFACGAIFGKQAQEEMDLPLDKRRGYFSRALLVGLKIGPPGAGTQITSTWLKGHITEHMRQASEGKFRKPLKPDFADEGAGEIVFGTASAAPSAYPVKIEVRNLQVTGLEIASATPGAPRVGAVRTAVDRAVFECRLPVGLYEAIPLSAALPPEGQEWLFKVIEGGELLAFDNSKLHITSRHDLFPVELLDHQFQRIARSYGQLEVEVPPGIYMARCEVGGPAIERLVKVAAGQSVEVPFVGRDIYKQPSAAPVPGSVSRHEFYTYPAYELVGRPEPHRSLGSGARLVLFATRLDFAEKQDWGANPRPVYWKGTKLRDSHGKVLLELPGDEVRDDDDRRWGRAGYCLDLNPGGYFLEWPLPETGEQSVALQPLWLAQDWTMQVFAGAIGDDPLPQRDTTSIHMTRSRLWPPSYDRALVYDPQLTRTNGAAELALASLRTGRRQLGDEHLHTLLYSKFENPMLGLLGAHMALERSEPNASLFAEVCGNLRELIGSHPDLLALEILGRKRFGHPTSPETAVPGEVDFPPMLRDGLMALDAAQWDQDRPLKLTAAAKLARLRVLAEGPWTLFWHTAPTTAAVARAIEPVHDEIRVPQYYVAPLVFAEAEASEDARQQLVVYLNDLRERRGEHPLRSLNPDRFRWAGLSPEEAKAAIASVAGMSSRYLEPTEIGSLSINTIRTLCMDAVQQANSGHPGTPMAMAPVVYVLWQEFLRFDPEDPIWPNRDRFILSAGHASTLLYSILHLSGVKAVNRKYETLGELAVPLEDLKNFRQLESRCPGHPEYRWTSGVETTTGPLGQGVATSVGIALASLWLAEKYNRPNFKMFDYDVYALAGDGCMMEGISSEAASLAGHLKLSNLCWIYDNNHITIEGNTSLAFSEDVARRFLAYGWNVLRVSNANDLDLLREAFDRFKKSTDRPTLIIVESHIAYGAPTKQDTSAAHGEPLGEQEIRATKRRYEWPEDAKFLVPPEVRQDFKDKIGQRGAKLRSTWMSLFVDYQKEFPELAAQTLAIQHRESPKDWDADIPTFLADAKGLATRDSSGKVLNAIAKKHPWLIGGSADLSPSTKTRLTFEGAGEISADSLRGRNIHFGVREHAMGAILNGLALAKLRAFGSGFLIFSDYGRGALRLSAIMELPVIYIFTHDSIGVGEDGPTHQPVEQLPSLRAIPGLVDIRPCDANEVVEAWRAIMEMKHEPVALILSRQALPTLDRSKFAPASGLRRGAYVLSDATDGKPDVLLIGTGSEVSLCLDAQEALKKQGMEARVISMPSWKLFEDQDEGYRESVLPSHIRARVSVEKAARFGWERYVGLDGQRIGMSTFGASAPLQKLLKKFGFTVDAVASAAIKQVESSSGRLFRMQ